ncbi:MAG: maltose alpha-D-glucosyltransferase [Acidobacteriota bacterium]|nr:maltose alpha-D-glucosyltransferase [Acidobacteriota bacterium]
MIDNDPLWYKDAIVYELHVRAFFDSNGDGMGDFAGLTAKLDYLRDLGITAIWLLPFCPSPWKDDGYDIADFTGVHPAYGTLKDFQIFLKEAHRRGLRVITELVFNHTSDQHEWFQRSRRAAPGSNWRDYYVWSDTPEKYQGARIIFTDFETSNWTYDPVAKAYYWHRFYSHQPDLNYDNPAVRKAMLRNLDFWANLGVDGFRLDAVPYLFEREGTNCENLPETHAYLKGVRAHLDRRHKDKMLLSEANMWPEDAIQYMGAGDECHMNFHFPLMPRLFMANRLEDRFPIVDIMKQTPEIPPSCQWALFLRNHDELTLEMVTDEERDYMYRTYADDRKARINVGIRRRLAPLLADNRRKIELMNALLFSLPGTPVIYYGDEIGMGDNFYLGDRNGVRTPMQWSSDRNAGFSNTNPQKLYLPVNIDPEYHFETRNVEAQQNNPNSLLWWMRRLIRLRKQYPAFGRGTLDFLSPENRRVLAFYRRHESETILVIANLSRFVQPVALNLSEFQGYTPVEMFGGTEFPVVGEQHYLFTLGPNAFYWFSLELREKTIESSGAGGVRAIELPVRAWEDVWGESARATLVRTLPKFLESRRWFLAKRKRIRAVSIQDRLPVRPGLGYVVLVRIDYDEGEPDIYGLPLALATGEKAEHVRREYADLVLAEALHQDGTRGVVYGALWDKDFNAALLEAVVRRRKFRGERGEMVAWRTPEFHAMWGKRHPNIEPFRLKAEHRNSSVAFGDRFVLKMFRHLEEGIHPEVEMGGFFARHRGFSYTAPLAGGFEYRAPGEEPVTLAVLHGLVPNEGDAYGLTLGSLSRFFEYTQLGAKHERLFEERRLPLELAREETPRFLVEVMGDYLDRVRTLGLRTAEMHNAFASETKNPAFEPERFSDHYRRALYHGLLSLTDRCLDALRFRAAELPGELRADAELVLSKQDEVRRFFQRIDARRVEALRTRVHGDFHLAQVLDTGKDFTIIDFEGDTAQHLSERRIKKSPLRDVAQMLNSFRYASYAALYGDVAGVAAETGLEAWAVVWYQWVSAGYLRGYLDGAANHGYLPVDPEDLRVLLDTFTMQQALIELRAELGAKPSRLRIPMREILFILR